LRPLHAAAAAGNENERKTLTFSQPPLLLLLLPLNGDHEQHKQACARCRTESVV
jgi:hypothetical protein